MRGMLNEGDAPSSCREIDELLDIYQTCEADVRLNNLLNAMAVLAEEWEKDGGYLNNPHDDPEDRAGGRVYQECAKALKKIASSI